MGYHVEEGPDGVPFVQLGHYTLRLDLEDLDGEYMERSRIELRETPEITNDALEELKNLIEGEEGLHVPLDDTSFLLKFLRPCKFYAQSAFKLMKRFYKFKAKNPQLGGNLLPENVKHVFEKEIITFVPTRCTDGSRLMIINMGIWNTKTISVIDLFRAIVLVLEVAMIEPKTQVAGVYVILDMRGLTLNHIWQFSPSFARTCTECVQECLPVRLKGLHVVNQPFIFKMLYSLFKPFIGEKLKRRLFFHGYDRKSLHAAIPKESLPAIYDGTSDVPDFPGTLLAEMLCRYNEDFEYCNKIGYTKEKLPEGIGPVLAKK